MKSLNDAMQMGAGARRQDPPGITDPYTASLPATAEGARAIQGAPSLMLASTPGSPTRPGTALTRRPATARPQTAGTRYNDLAGSGCPVNVQMVSCNVSLFWLNE